MSSSFSTVLSGREDNMLRCRGSRRQSRSSHDQRDSREECGENLSRQLVDNDEEVGGDVYMLEASRTISEKQDDAGMDP